MSSWQWILLDSSFIDSIRLESGEIVVSTSDGGEVSFALSDVIVIGEWVKAEFVPIEDY